MLISKMEHSAPEAQGLQPLGFRLSSSCLFPRYISNSRGLIGNPSHDEEQIAEAVQVDDELRRNLGRRRESHDESLRPPVKDGRFGARLDLLSELEGGLLRTSRPDCSARAWIERLRPQGDVVPVPQGHGHALAGAVYGHVTEELEIGGRR